MGDSSNFSFVEVYTNEYKFPFESNNDIVKSEIRIAYIWDKYDLH